MGAEIVDPEGLRARLERWLAGQLSSSSEPVATVELSALTSPKTGQSNETVMFDASWRQCGQLRTQGFVLRLQPRANQMFHDADVIRDGRLLQRMNQLGTIPLPVVHAVEEDPSFLGAPFFLMSKVVGHAPGGLPSVHFDPWLSRLSPEQRAQLTSNAIHALAQVHAVDPELASGILPMPDHRSGALAADVSRLLDWYEWARRGRDFPVLDAALAEIRSGLAHDSGTRVLLWGDPRLGNMIVSEDLTVAALLDWEMAGIGQPELDVGWWLMMDEFAYRGLDGSVPQYLPSPGQIVATYESVTGRSLADLDFFQLVAAVKLAITLIPTSDSLTAKGTLEPGSRFATENVPTQMVARLLGMPEPDLCPDYRRFSRMDRASR